MKKAYSSILMMLLLWCPFSIYAGGASRMDSANLFDNIIERFHVAASMWGKVLVGYGTWLFWSLALISMAWTFGMMALRKADPQEFFAEFVQFLVTTGFFFWILLNGPEIASSIIDSLRRLAANATGLEWHITPSSMVDVGFDIVGKAIDHSSVWSPGSTMVGILVAGVILVVLALIAVNMLIILITGWILVYGGVVVLGFGGGRWTQDIAINYYRTVVGIGLQAFTMLLIVGIGHSFIDQYYAMMASDILLKEMFIMLVVALMLLVFINKIPPVIGGLVHGGGFGGGGSGGGASLGVGGAMGAAGLAATAAGAAYAQMGGGVQALSAAFKAAQQSMGESTTGASGSSGGALSSLAQAMGGAGQFAGSFGAHLASGAVSAVKDKMSGASSAMSEKSSNTIGGKIADKINQRMSGDDSVESAEASSSSSHDTESNSDPNAQSNVEPMQVSSGDIQTQNSDASGSFDEVRAFVNQDTSDPEEQFQ